MPNLFCDRNRKCSVCFNCKVDARDSLNGVCPKDACPYAGGFPKCIDGAKFLDLSKCKSSYKFEVSVSSATSSYLHSGLGVSNKS